MTKEEEIRKRYRIKETAQGFAVQRWCWFFWNTEKVFKTRIFAEAAIEMRVEIYLMPLLPGDMVTSNCKYDLSRYFKDGPLQVIRVQPGPSYAGDWFVYCLIGDKEQGFYYNGLKKV